MSINRKTVWLVLPMMSLCACSTVAVPPAKPYLDVALRQPCAPLPKLYVRQGEDLRSAVLLNRVHSDAVHEACRAQVLGVLKAVGVEALQ